MKTKVYAVMDNKLSAFMTPFFSHNDETAQRSILVALSHAESAIAVAPDDYDLYKIGIFDDESGLIDSEPTPVFVVRAANLKKTEN